MLFAHALICLLTICLSLNGDTTRRWWGEGCLQESQGQDGSRVRILHLKGTPYEIGFQHGTLLKDLIKKNVAEFIDNSQPALVSKSYPCPI